MPAIKKEIRPAHDWFKELGWKPFPFQKEAWQAYLDGCSGLVNAPTGSGKTYSLFMGIALDHLRRPPNPGKNGLIALWITPIRALAKEIYQSCQRAIDGLGLDWRIAIRSGDTPSSERQKISRKPPEILITTPESLQLLLAKKGYPRFFQNLECVVVDEWHELIGSKRGVQMELALSRLCSIRPQLRVWGISATIGNMDQALQVLMAPVLQKDKIRVIRADIHKQIEVVSVLPDEIEMMPWAGHLGIKLLEKVVPILRASRSTLIFTNTRAQAEIWYQKLLEADPSLAGIIAMHHGSISRELRNWVEDALHEEKLKAVVCTSSLDLGVDFRPVETIIQIGGPKGVARFMQRAGRSGHAPGQKSRIYFLPTNSLELIEAAALRGAIQEGKLESRIPYVRSFDVLVQYLVTLAVSEGFQAGEILQEIRRTFSFNSVSDEEWDWCLQFIVQGGEVLQAYDDFQKVIVEDGTYRVESRRIALRHRLSIGTIVSDGLLQVKYMKGGHLGHVEEWFVSKMKPGDVFWFAGRSLELVKVREMQVLVKRSKQKTGKVPAFMGSRMPLSSEMGAVLRSKLMQAMGPGPKDPELEFLQPLLALQEQRSHVPGEGEFLVEYFHSREGYHLLMYPFEGRFVHEGMGALLAYRFSLFKPISFSIAMNDYGFELLSDQPIPIQEFLDNDLLSPDHLMEDIQEAVNSTEMARRKFRDIAYIAGLVFKGYPGKPQKDKHLQANAQLFFDVFREYAPDNLLLRQAYEEVMDFQLEEARLRAAMERIQQQKLILTQPDKPTPFAFPIMVDRLRERFSNEKLIDRVQKMQIQYS